MHDAVPQAVAQHVLHDFAHAALLLLDRHSGIDDVEAHLLRHSLVLVEDAALKDAEALLHVAGQAQVHAGLVILERVASAQDAAQSDIERHAEIKAQVGMDGEAVEVADPTAAHPAGHVARERGVGVSVGADDGARFDQRQDVTFHAVGEIGSVDQAEGGWSEHLLALAAARGLAHQRGGIPLAESHGIALGSQPMAEQRHLGGLSGTIDPFDHDQLAAVPVGHEQGHKGQRLFYPKWDRPPSSWSVSCVSKSRPVDRRQNPIVCPTSLPIPLEAALEDQAGAAAAEVETSAQIDVEYRPQFPIAAAEQLVDLRLAMRPPVDALDPAIVLERR